MRKSMHILMGEDSPASQAKAVAPATVSWNSAASDALKGEVAPACCIFSCRSAGPIFSLCMHGAGCEARLHEDGDREPSQEEIHACIR